MPKGEHQKGFEQVCSVRSQRCDTCVCLFSRPMWKSLPRSHLPVCALASATRLQAAVLGGGNSGRVHGKDECNKLLRLQSPGTICTSVRTIRRDKVPGKGVP